MELSSSFLFVADNQELVFVVFANQLGHRETAYGRIAKRDEYGIWLKNSDVGSSWYPYEGWAARRLVAVYNRRGELVYGKHAESPL